MPKSSGNSSQSYPNRRKIFLFIILGIAALSLFVFLYFWFVEPLVSAIIYKPDMHNGLSYYESGEYLTFESGSNFQEMLSKDDTVSTGRAIDFRHFDNAPRDNPIHGKACDVFSLDVQLDSQQFLFKQEQIATTHSYVWSKGDYELYLLEDNSCTNGDIQLIAYCETNQTIRYILLTEVSPIDEQLGEDARNYKINAFLTRHSSLQWNIQQTEDG